MNFIEALEEMEKGKVIIVGTTRFKIIDNKLLVNFLCNNYWNECKDTFNYLNGLNYELYQEPILDDKEKEFLKEVIKPFRSKVKYIKKFRADVDKQHIAIFFKDINDIHYHIEFSPFKNNTMYIGMKLYKAYTIKELGL